MIELMARYRVRKNAVDQVKQAVAWFVQQVHKHEKGTLRYEAFQLLKSPTDFVHFMRFADKKAESLHRKTHYVKEFVRVLYPLYERKPRFFPVRNVK